MCVLDGLDECKEESLKQLLDVLGEYFLESKEKPTCLKVILLSRPQPGLLESKLRRFRRIKLDDSDMEVGKDVEKFITAKVAELASEQTLTITDHKVVFGYHIIFGLRAVSFSLRVFSFSLRALSFSLRAFPF